MRITQQYPLTFLTLPPAVYTTEKPIADMSAQSLQEIPKKPEFTDGKRSFWERLQMRQE